MIEAQDQQQQFFQEQEIHLADYLNILLRRLNIFVSTFIAIFVGVCLVTFLMRPVYQASSTVYVKKDSGKMGINELVMPGGDNSIQAEMEVIKSRTIAEQVVQKLHLDWNIKPSSSSAMCRLIDIALVPSARDLTLDIIGKGFFYIKDDNGKIIAKGRNNVPLYFPSGSITVELIGEESDSFELHRVPLYKAVAALKGATKVKEVGRLTNVVEVSYEHTNAILARDVVNTMVQAYLDQSLAFKTQEAGKSVSFIEEQLQGIRNDLNKAETNLQEYKSSSGVVQLDAEAQEIIKKFSNFSITL